MKVYFTGSLHNPGVDKPLYIKMIKYLEKKGNTVKSDHIIKYPLSHIEDISTTVRDPYYKQLISWIDEADCVLCEISYPSTVNIGHEVTLALDRGKPVIALYQPQREPRLLLGIKNEKLILLEYAQDNLFENLDFGIEAASKLLDIRFTLILPPQIVSHLDKIAKSGRSRSAYIRQLIEKDMKK